MLINGILEIIGYASLSSGTMKIVKIGTNGSMNIWGTFRVDRVLFIDCRCTPEILELDSMNYNHLCDVLILNKELC